MSFYRETIEYVVCDECGSHILIDQETREREFDPGDTDLKAKFWSLTCDNDECEADLMLEVRNPYYQPPCFRCDDDTFIQFPGGRRMPCPACFWRRDQDEVMILCKPQAQYTNRNVGK